MWNQSFHMIVLKVFFVFNNIRRSFHINNFYLMSFLVVIICSFVQMHLYFSKLPSTYEHLIFYGKWYFNKYSCKQFLCILILISVEHMVKWNYNEKVCSFTFSECYQIAQSSLHFLNYSLAFRMPSLSVSFYLSRIHEWLPLLLPPHPPNSSTGVPQGSNLGTSLQQLGS